MRPFFIFVVVLLVAWVSALHTPSAVEAIPTDDTADIVFGQPNFTSSACNTGGISASTVCRPGGMAFDASGNLYVADANNYRILIYDSPLTTDTIADRVIGQPNFTTSGCNSGGISASSLCGPGNISFDSAGRLWVADSDNNRVLVYNNPALNDLAADFVIGQPDFLSNGCAAPSASTFCDPQAVEVDAAGNLWLVESFQNRVLQFDSPLTTDYAADRVLGQPDMSSVACNYSGVNASGLCLPVDLVALPGGDVVVSDGLNSRALKFTQPLTTDTVADLAIGQPNMSSAGCNSGGLSSSSLCIPFGLDVEGSSILYVTDRFNNRVLRYDGLADSTADAVYGQGGSFTANSCLPADASSLCHPIGVRVDAAGHLWVSQGFYNEGPEIERVVVRLNSFVVNDTGDAVDAAIGDGTCATAGAVCTLRAAIAESNASPGTNVIDFALGAGVPVIAPGTVLPTITDSVAIRANTGGATRIEIHPSGFVTTGLRVTASNSLFDHLVINGFAQQGIWLESGGSNTVRDSYIGTNAAGTIALINGNLGSTSGGVYITSSSNTITNNLISGNGRGVNINASGSDNTLTRNIIGLNATQSAVLSNGFGATVFGTTNNIGLNGDPASANVISGNISTGLVLFGSTNRVYSNVIGSNSPAINVDFGNGQPGPASGISAGGTGQIIGGPFGPNYISGNSQDGITITAGSGHVVQSNYIGVGLDGIGGYIPIPNDRDGVNTTGSSTIGSSYGYGPEGNLIAYNGAHGVVVHSPSAVGNRISANRIYSNGGIGIELGDGTPATLGVTPNDLGDPDTGGNGLQNFPVITSAKAGGGLTYVDGTLNTTPFTILRIEFFSSPTCDASGHGEGEVYVAGTYVYTDGSGNALFSVALGPSAPAGYALTTTATDDLNGNTSEFSACTTIVSCPGSDLDCDTFTDTGPSAHQGPANTNSSVDNCAGLHNPTQQNADGNYVDNSPPYAPATDDKTWAKSDAIGDACDTDADNDGRTNADEVSGTGCAFVTNALLRDTDGDRFLDGAECTLGTDPTNAASKPLLTACGAAGDADGDKVATRVEVCFYNTNPAVVDTDGDAALDGAKDGCEVASFNADRIVNSLDQAMLAQGIIGVVVYTPNMDINKDGVLNSIDQGLQAQYILPPGQCP